MADRLERATGLLLGLHLCAIALATQASEETRPACDSAPFCAEGNLVSLNFQEVGVRPVLQIIASLAGINMVVSDAVEGRVTLRLESVHWRNALDLVLRSEGLAQYSSEGVLVVGTQEEVALQNRKEIEHNSQLARLSPLQTQHIEILHATAAEVASLLKKSGQDASGVLSERGSALVDERTNTLVLVDTSDRLTLLREIIRRVDVPVKQVLIEAQIVTANVSFSRRLGVRWGSAGFDSGRNLSIAGSRSGLSEVSQGNLNYHTYPLNVNLGVNAEQAARFAVGLVSGGFMLDLELSALATEGNGEVVARPKIVTADKQSATITSGVEIAFQETSASGATATSFKQAVMQLKVRPHITPDGRISMSLHVSQDSLGEVVNGVPLINTNQLDTRVLVGDGETVVLGGVYRTRKTRAITKTPLLGDIPLLGRLFRHTSLAESKQELLIFITPKIIEDSTLDFDD